MSGKILILNRPRNLLKIQDEDDEFSYTRLYDITHIELEVDGSYEIFNRKSQESAYRGYITNVKEVKEEW